MLRNYLLTALRAIRRRKGHAFINVAGLTLGLTCCILIFEFVAFQLSFDAFNEKAGRIYRITRVASQNGGEATAKATMGYEVAPAYAQEVPEIVRYARLHPEYSGAVVTYEGPETEHTFKEERAFYADSMLLSLFTFPLAKGDPNQALRRPQTLLLTETAARKYFGDEDPVGKALEYTGAVRGTYTVSGVLKDVPANSHLQFDLLLPIQDLLNTESQKIPNMGWWNDASLSYLELDSGVSLPVIESKLTEVLYRHRGEAFKAANSDVSVKLQPLRSVYLDQETAVRNTQTGDPRTVYFLSIIALVTLAIALINYVNLATARAMDRAREVGIRKVVGAQRAQLMGQFMLESVLTNLTSFVLALVAAAMLSPVLNQLAGTELSLGTWASGPFLYAFIGVFAVAVVLSGLYPAFVLSSLKPVTVLKGKAHTSGVQAGLRKGLVVLQFAASMVLLIGTGIVYAQVDYMRRMDVGLTMDQVLVVSMPRIMPEGIERSVAQETFAGEVRKLLTVSGSAVSGTTPGRGFPIQAPVRRAAADASNNKDIAYATGIDHDFMEMYGLRLLAGTPLREDMPGPAGDQPFPALINETAVRLLGFQTNDEAINQQLALGGIPTVVQGVLKDFNWSSLHQPREPVLLLYQPTAGQISFKVSAADLPGTLAAIEGTYKEMFPGNPFDYYFADEAFDQQYANDQRFATLLSIFATLAIVIACLGLFGLASFTAEQRTKEIGIRKVLGATVSGIVVLLSRDFLKLVLAACVIAVPVAWYLMSRWLEGFAYRIEIGPAVFLIAGALAVLIALATISYQSIKAATADPVKSLRYE